MKNSTAPRLSLSVAGTSNIESVYRLRHDVYSTEIRQYKSNPEGILPDSPGMQCTYLLATLDDNLVGMVGITPPKSPSYSVDKFLPREEIPYSFDETLYEIRALTVKREFRGLKIASALMYGGFRWIESHGGKWVISIGRQEVLDMYLRLGMERLGKTFECGDVQYELIGAAIEHIASQLNQYDGQLERLKSQINWEMGISFRSPEKCYHGGAFFDGIGNRFDNLRRKDDVISGDVLDAWFSPPERVQELLIEHLPFAMRTSPPTGAEGLEQIIAEYRGVKPGNILTNGGSSALIFLAFRQWLDASSRVLILSPSYGEYGHVLEKIVGCKVDRMTLNRQNGYRLDLKQLKGKLSEGFDLFVWVNPNSPTGLHVAKAEVEAVVKEAEACKRIWIDETYVDYVGPGHSLESFAAGSENVIVCKSMSKVYGLSGMRVAYLCASPHQLEDLRLITPPWSVSLPAQMATTLALQSGEYYEARHTETHKLREELAMGLRGLGIDEIIPGVANFLLFHLPAHGLDAVTLIHKCREEGLYLRDASGMGTASGSNAIRIAVKDAATNRRMLEILTAAYQTS